MGNKTWNKECGLSEEEWKFEYMVDMIKASSTLEGIGILRKLVYNATPIKKEERESAEEQVFLFKLVDRVKRELCERYKEKYPIITTSDNFATNLAIKVAREYASQKAPLKDTKDAEEWWGKNHGFAKIDGDVQEAITKEEFNKYLSKSEPKQRMYTEEEKDLLQAVADRFKGKPMGMLCNGQVDAINDVIEYLQSLNK